MNRERLNIAIFSSTLIVLLALDQWVKAWVRGSMNIHGSYGGKPWPGVFELTLTYNQGIAFGMFDGRGKFLAPIAIIIAVGATWYSLKHREESWPSHLAMGLITAGAIGNLIDRLWRGEVTDMFWFRAINFPVFNVADSCITVAVCLLILIWWREAIDDRRRPGKVSETKPEEPAA